mmetsp:Transcript_18614/g.60163  ORF Transcript_18614/g.60163 Transcript_18614/m.60163 type:complete len:272 (-) Transcript_18614:4-819(-)
MLSDGLLAVDISVRQDQRRAPPGIRPPDLPLHDLGGLRQGASSSFLLLGGGRVRVRVRGVVVKEAIQLCPPRDDVRLAVDDPRRTLPALGLLREPPQQRRAKTIRVVVFREKSPPKVRRVLVAVEVGVVDVALPSVDARSHGCPRRSAPKEARDGRRLPLLPRRPSLRAAETAPQVPPLFRRLVGVGASHALPGRRLAFFFFFRPRGRAFRPRRAADAAAQVRTFRLRRVHRRAGRAGPRRRQGRAHGSCLLLSDDEERIEGFFVKRILGG